MNKTWGSGMALAAAFAGAVACGSETEEGFSEATTSSGGGGTSTSGSNIDGTSSGQNGGDAAAKECVAQEAQATFAKRPVDIVIAIDNSGSMSAEIEEVESQINQNFASIIGASGIDYRVIMVSRHGANEDEKVCIGAPLSGGACDPLPEQPLETATFFHHSTPVESFDSFRVLLRAFSRPDEFDLHPTGYGALLRPSAFKVFLVITDDRVDTKIGDVDVDDENTAEGGAEVATRFDEALLALSPEQFGTPAVRNYLWHSIIALAPFDAADTTLAHPPTAPIVTSVCTPSAKNPGTGYQALSKLTGGLRYPSCGLDYTTIFRNIADGIVEGAKIACEFPVPAAPAGQNLDLSTVVARFTPNGGTPQQYAQVSNLAACVDNAFYIEAEIIKLCPSTCAAVNLAPGDLKIAYGCAPEGPR